VRDSDDKRRLQDCQDEIRRLGLEVVRSRSKYRASRIVSTAVLVIAIGFAPGTPRPPRVTRHSIFMVFVLRLVKTFLSVNYFQKSRFLPDFRDSDSWGLLHKLEKRCDGLHHLLDDKAKPFYLIWTMDLHINGVAAITR
jgi:hypothetical protein